MPQLAQFGRTVVLERVTGNVGYVFFFFFFRTCMFAALLARYRGGVRVGTTHYA